MTCHAFFCRFFNKRFSELNIELFVTFVLMNTIYIGLFANTRQSDHNLLNIPLHSLWYNAIQYNHQNNQKEFKRLLNKEIQRSQTKITSRCFNSIWFILFSWSIWYHCIKPSCNRTFAVCLMDKIHWTNSLWIKIREHYLLNGEKSLIRNFVRRHLWQKRIQNRSERKTKH